MMKMFFTVLVASLFLISGFATISSANEHNPENLLLKSSTSEKKPASVFPHLAHQKDLSCGDCHHGMKDGQKIAYEEGMEIKKCESCHNAELMAGKKAGKYELDTFKGVGHANCLECHKEIAQQDPEKNKLKSCGTCHQK